MLPIVSNLKNYNQLSYLSIAVELRKFQDDQSMTKNEFYCIENGAEIV